MKPHPFAVAVFLLLMTACVSAQTANRPVSPPASGTAARNATAAPNVTMVPIFLKNLDDLILQVNFMRNQKFNSSMVGTDLMALNNRVYAFQWQNGIFTRLPFPANLTFYDCDGVKPEIARVVTPLKNRFAPRAVNRTQMDCPLYVRVIENNHYEGKFTRTVLEFTSPCLEYPVYKYLMNKTGLRNTLRLSLFGVRLTFQFRGAVFVTGRHRVQSYTEYRLLKPHYHPIFVPDRKYLRDNSTASNANYRGKVLTPTQIIALQVESLELLRENALQHEAIFNSTEQAEGYKSRNDTLNRPSRKAKTVRGPGRNQHLRHPNFRFPEKTQKKTKKVLKNLIGAENLPKLKKMLWEKLHQGMAIANIKRNWKAKQAKAGHPERELSDQEAWKMARNKWRKVGRHRERKLEEKGPNVVNSFTLSSNFLNFVKSKERNLKQTSTDDGQVTSRKRSSASPNAKRSKSKTGRKRASRRSLQSNSSRRPLRTVLNEILANEPYKVDTCQKICTPEHYYPSWNFCLRVCGIRYNFLSNIHDDTSRFNLFPNIQFIRVAGGRFFIHSGKQDNTQFTYDQIQQLKNAEDVRTCRKTWRTFICDWGLN